LYAPSVWPSSLTKRFSILVFSKCFKMLQYALKCYDMHKNVSGATKIAYQCSSFPELSHLQEHLHVSSPAGHHLRRLFIQIDCFIFKFLI
jgi:hypothetical protein